MARGETVRRLARSLRSRSRALEVAQPVDPTGIVLASLLGHLDSRAGALQLERILAGLDGDAMLAARDALSSGAEAYAQQVLERRPAWRPVIEMGLVRAYELERSAAATEQQRRSALVALTFAWRELLRYERLQSRVKSTPPPPALDSAS